MEKRCEKGWSTPERPHKRITVRSNVHVDKLRARELRAERFYMLRAMRWSSFFCVFDTEPKQNRSTDQW